MESSTQEQQVEVDQTEDKKESTGSDQTKKQQPPPSKKDRKKKTKPEIKYEEFADHQAEAGEPGVETKEHAEDPGEAPYKENAEESTLETQSEPLRDESPDKNEVDPQADNHGNQEYQQPTDLSAEEVLPKITNRINMLKEVNIWKKTKAM
jgi:hypothetical protein